MFLKDITQLLLESHPELPRLLALAVSMAVVAVFYRILSNSLSRVGKRLEFDPHTLNSLRLVLRVITLFVALTVGFSIYALPTEWFVGTSALVGAAIGFGSSQTINNIVAGLYVLVSKPFRVKDYVKIGEVEGQVEEISINYTKIYTPSFNLLLIPNVQVMNNRVLNCTHEGLIKYTFSLSFPQGSPLSSDEISNNCVKPAIEEFYSKYGSFNLRMPEHYFESSTAAAKSFKIRIFVPKGDAKTLYQLQPELAGMITNRWDVERLRHA